MRHFSIPADFCKATIDKYAELNHRYKNSAVVETYGSITAGAGNFLASGRLVKQMVKVDLFDLHEYIDYSRQKNIDFCYTLNPPHIHNREFTEEGIIEIKDFVYRLYDAGVRTLTVTLPSLIELIRSTGLDLKIRASTICQITNANKAMFYKSLRVDEIVVDESVNRDFYTLRSIREAFNGRVEVIANQVCDLNCIYRMFHYNMIAGEPMGTTNDVSIDFYEHRCVLQQFKSVGNLLKLSWIRPEDLKYYTAVGIDFFKLQGRHTFVRGGDPVRTAECYFRESHDGNLIDLLTMFTELTSFQAYIDNKKLDGFLEPFFKSKNFCDNNCTNCNYCETYARRAVDYRKTEEIVRSARDFYDEYDQYKQILKHSGPVRENVARDGELDMDVTIDFDIR